MHCRETSGLAPARRGRPRLRFAAAASLLLLGLAGCRSSPLGRDAGGLPNFGRVDDGLLRSGQPTHEGLLQARDLGVRTVVNLRSAHGDDAVASGTGLDVVSIPSHASTLDDDRVARFLAVATDPGRRPVLVHCREGRDRTGALVAAYRIAVEGWSRDRAIAEMDGYGAWPLFAAPRAYLRAFDPQRVLALARSRPPAPAAAAR